MFHQVKTLYIQSHWKKENPKALTTLRQQQNENDYYNKKTRKTNSSNNNDNIISFCQNWRPQPTNNCNKNIQLTKKLNCNSRSSSLVQRQGSSGAVGHGTRPTIDFCRFKHKMANTLSVMTNVLRNVVSKQRIRYKEKGFNLDLAYICDNIIAMGYPADNIEKIYRNRLEDVYKFLEENHHDHYKIYNLCLERSYDVNKFHGRVAAYPFEDHNPPTIELIQRFCADVDAWLKANPDHVAAVHCKAGKGRTGTMICCYLLYSNQQQTADNALAHYGEKRTKDRKGVTIPSQRRYVQYFAKLLRSNLRYERRYLEFFEIRFSEAHMLYSQGNVHCAISVLQDSESCLKVQPLQNLTIDFRKSFTLDMKNFGLRVSGDIKVELSHKTSKKKIFHFWFNTFFVGDSAVLEGEGENAKLVYTLNKCEIDDAHKDKEHKLYTEDFKVQLAFYNEGPETDLNRSNDNHPSNQHTYAQSSRVENSLVATSGTTTTTVATASLTTTGSGLLSDIQFICDQKQQHQQQQNTNTLLYNATATALATVGTVSATDGMSVKKPYTHLNHHLEDIVERRPASLINYNNISPHKYIAHQQQQQYRRSESLNSSTLQKQNDLKTLEELSSYNNHYTRHQQQLQQDTIAASSTKLSGTTVNHNNSHNNSNSHCLSNISNSSNSSFNSHLTSVSSSASMASSANANVHHHNHADKKHHDNDVDDDDNDDNDDDDDDNEDDDDDDDDDNEEDWESGESAVVKPLPSTTTSTTTTTTTIRYCKKLVTTSSATTSTTITFIPTTTTISSTTLTTEKQKTKLPNLLPSSVSNPQEKLCCYLHKMQCNNCSSYCKFGDIYINDNGNNHIINDNNHIHNDDDDDGNINVAINLNNINANNDYDNNPSTAKLFKFEKINDKVQNNDDIQAINNYNDEVDHKCVIDKNAPITKYNHDYDHKTITNEEAGLILLKSSSTTAAETRATLAKSKRSNKILTTNLTARYKFVHLLTASKASTKIMASKHSYFKRKSLKSIETAAAFKSSTSTAKATTASSSSNYYNLASGGGDDDEKIELRTRTISAGSSGGCGGGVGGNLAKASKLKLKMSFTKTNSKLKWTQKFHWLQNYVRSADARAELRKSFAKSTSNQRLNSNSSNSKNFIAFNKIPETKTDLTNLNKNPTKIIDSENLSTYKSSSVGSLLQENCFLENPDISIATVNDNEEDDDNDNINNNNNIQVREFSTNIEHDYYSSICDNQLSFNNSPCKSPRSLVEDMKIINNHSRQHLQQQELPTPSAVHTKSKSTCNQEQPQQKHLNPSVTITNNDATHRIVVVAARPASKQSIGFNIKSNPITTTITSNDSGSNSSSGYATTTTTNSGSSIYGTPPTSKEENDSDEIDAAKVKQSPFVFPSISAEITELAQVLKTTTITTSSNEPELGNGSIKTHNKEKEQQQIHQFDKNEDE